jgi:hypothetical protein
MSPRASKLAAVLVAFLMSISGASQAGLFRAYLSVNGNDAHPCTIAQPCRLLPAALAAVDDGGEIWMVDSANYNTGPVVVTKSVSILAIPGAIGSVVGNGGNAIEIDTPGGSVALRNLKIRNLAAGTHGVEVLDAARVIVDRCEISGFRPTGGGIRTRAAVIATVLDSIVRDSFVGIWFDGGVAGHVVRTSVVDNGIGIFASPGWDNPANVAVTDSIASGNTSGIGGFSDSALRVVTITIDRSTATLNNNYGFQCLGTGGGSCRMDIADSIASRNGYGVHSDGNSTSTIARTSANGNTNAGFYNLSSGLMLVSGSTATGNVGHGFANAGVGVFRSLGNNAVNNNGVDTSGTITTILPK